MDPRLLRFYNDELSFLRHSASEFAAEHENVAGRLHLKTPNDPDPYVERLLEGVAFLGARVRLQMDEQYPEFTSHLLQTIQPHFLAPVPSMAIVEFEPQPSDQTVLQGFRIKRGTQLTAYSPSDNHADVIFSTGHEVVLWPLAVKSVDYLGARGQIGEFVGPAGRVSANAGLKIRLTAEQGINLADVRCDALTFYLTGSQAVPFDLYRQMFGDCVGAVARPVGSANAVWTRLPLPKHVGFENDEALLPAELRSFRGYRLIQEYFACPERFLFAKIEGLAPCLAAATNEIEIVLLFDRAAPSLVKNVDRGNLRLYATPAINLFEKRLDAFEYKQTEHEFLLEPERNRPHDYEVFRVLNVRAEVRNNERRAEMREVAPVFAPSNLLYDWNSALYFSLRIGPSRLSSVKQKRMKRIDYVGTSQWISLSAPGDPDTLDSVKSIHVNALVTNRELASMLDFEGPKDFVFTGVPARTVTIRRRPSKPRQPFMHQERRLDQEPAGRHLRGAGNAWQLIGHLSANYTTLAPEDHEDPTALRDHLVMYLPSEDAALRRQIDGILGVRSRKITRRVPQMERMAIARGHEITIRLDDRAFEDGSLFLFGAVLERFLAEFASINSFTQTVIETANEGRIKQWPPRVGRRANI